MEEKITNAIAWVISCIIKYVLFVGIMKLITMCFSIGFSISIVSGIWLILQLVRLFIGGWI